MFSSSYLSCELKVNPVWNPARACCFIFVVLWILYHFELNHLIQRLSFLCGSLSNGMLFQRLVKGSILCKENHLSFMILKLPYVHVFKANYGNSGRDKGSLELLSSIETSCLNEYDSPAWDSTCTCMCAHISDTHAKEEKADLIKLQLIIVSPGLTFFST